MTDFDPKKLSASEIFQMFAGELPPLAANIIRHSHFETAEELRAELLRIRDAAYTDQA